MPTRPQNLGCPNPALSSFLRLRWASFMVLRLAVARRKAYQSLSLKFLQLELSFGAARPITRSNPNAMEKCWGRNFDLGSKLRTLLLQGSQLLFQDLNVAGPAGHFSRLYRYHRDLQEPSKEPKQQRPPPDLLPASQTAGLCPPFWGGRNEGSFGVKMMDPSSSYLQVKTNKTKKHRVGTPSIPSQERTTPQEPIFNRTGKLIICGRTHGKERSRLPSTSSSGP